MRRLGWILAFGVLTFAAVSAAGASSAAATVPAAPAATHHSEKALPWELAALFIGGALLLALITHLALKRNTEARRLQQALGQLRATNRTLQVLSDCNQILVRTKTVPELMDSMCRILVEKGGFALAWIGMADPTAAKRVKPVAAHGETGYLEDIEISWDETEAGSGPTGLAVRSGQPSISRDILTDPTTQRWRARAARFGFRSSIALPLGSAVPAYGALNLYSREPLHFDEVETRLLGELAGDLDYGLQALRADERRRQVEREVEQQGKRFQALVDKSADGVAVADRTGQLLYVGSSISRLLGYAPAEMTGRSAFEFVHPEDVPEVTQRFTACAAVDDSSLEVLARGRHKRGGWRWVDATLTNLLRDPAVGGIVVNFRDVTQRRELQERLVIEHQRSHVFLRKSSDAVHILDGELRLVDASDSFIAALGWSREELLGRDPSFWDASFSDTVRAEGIAEARAGTSRRFETRHRRKDGSLFWVEVVTNPFELAGAVYVHCSARDLTEVRKLQHEVVGAATREQRRLAYELHDALGQELTAARLLADAYAARAGPRGAELAEGFREVGGIVTRSLLTARRIVNGLSPLVADRGDLAAGLARLAADSSGTSVQVRLTDATFGAVAIPVEDRSQLFRIAQEAVQNALKHADAHRIDIQLGLDGPELQLTVADDGTGIADQTDSTGGGHGMQTMRYRANALGGRLAVRARPEGGTVVVCSVPNQPREDAPQSAGQDRP